MDAASYVQPQKVAIIQPGLFSVEDRCSADGQRQVELLTHFHAEKAARRNADHFKGSAADRECAANGALRPTEVILPETIAEYGYGWAAAPVIRIGNQASHCGVHPQGAEKSAADPDSVGRMHRPALGEIQLILVAPSEHLGENVLVVTHLLPDWIGKGARLTVPIRGAVLQLHQLLRPLDRQIFQNYGVHQAEDGNVGADSQGQR